jgi:hypothetical protein
MQLKPIVIILACSKHAVSPNAEAGPSTKLRSWEQVLKIVSEFSPVTDDGAAHEYELAEGLRQVSWGFAAQGEGAKSVAVAFWAIGKAYADLGAAFMQMATATETEKDGHQKLGKGLEHLALATEKQDLSEL